MAMEDARAFVTHINEVTGRFPGLYSGSYIKELLGSGKDPVLAQCWFCWRNMVQQRSCLLTGRRGPCGNTPTAQSGLSRIRSPASATCDRDKFNGTEDQLRTLWQG
jgi:lysozyme